MIVMFNPKVPHVLTVPFKGNPKKAVVTGSVMLRPGSNQVNDLQWSYMQTILQPKIDSGEISTVTIIKEKEKAGKIVKQEEAKTLPEMEPDEAVKVVGQCINLDTLNEWKKIPKLSDEVRFAITKQIEEITVKGETTKGKKDK